MANTKTTKSSAANAAEKTSAATAAANPQTTAPEELNLDQQVTIRNLSNWTVGFARINSIGDVTIPQKGVVRIARGELISQAQNGNKLLNGLDDLGSHATIYIEDEATRRAIGYEDDERKQLVFSDDLVKEVFGKGKTAFEKAFKETFVTRSEKMAVMESITRLGINDFTKIRFAEDTTGLKAK